MPDTEYTENRVEHCISLNHPELAWLRLLKRILGKKLWEEGQLGIAGGYPRALREPDMGGGGNHGGGRHQSRFDDIDIYVFNYRTWLRLISRLKRLERRLGKTICSNEAVYFHDDDEDDDENFPVVPFVSRMYWKGSYKGDPGADPKRGGYPVDSIVPGFIRSLIARYTKKRAPLLVHPLVMMVDVVSTSGNIVNHVDLNLIYHPVSKKERYEGDCRLAMEYVLQNFDMNATRVGLLVGRNEWRFITHPLAVWDMATKTCTFNSDPYASVFAAGSRYVFRAEVCAERLYRYCDLYGYNIDVDSLFDYLQRVNSMAENGYIEIDPGDKAQASFYGLLGQTKDELREHFNFA